MKKKKEKILIIEDEDSIRNALKDKLVEVGFLVLEAKNGEEGFNIAVQEQPDLILLDLIMPVMDGVSTLRRIRIDRWGKDVKVIILTNLSDNERVADCLSLGARIFLVKTDWK